MAKSDLQAEYRKRLSITILTAVALNALIILLVPGFRKQVVESFQMVSLKDVPKTVPPIPPRQERKVVQVRQKIQFSPIHESASLPPATPTEQFTEGPELASTDSQGGEGSGYLLSGSSKPIPMRSIGMAILPDDFGSALPSTSLSPDARGSSPTLDTGRSGPMPSASGFDITGEISSILPAGAVQPPTVVKSVPPAYPEKARLAGIEGKVLLKVRVLYDGTISEVRVLKSSGRADFDQAALDCVKHWEFRPAMQSGIRVDVWISIPVNFEITNK